MYPNGSNSFLRSHILLIISFFVIITGSNAQIDYEERGLYFDSTHRVIWPAIEQELNLEEDTSIQFIVDIVDRFCEDNLDCQYHSFDLIRYFLAIRTRYIQAIYILEQQRSIARIRNDLEAEADTYFGISSYHDVLGNARLAISYIDKAIALYKQLDIPHDIASSEMYKLVRSMDYDPPEVFLPKMDKLWEEAVIRKDSGLLFTMSAEFVYINIDNERYDKVQRHIDYIELHHAKYWKAAAISGELVYAKYGRARLALEKGDIDKAREYFEEALSLTVAGSSLWMQVDLLEEVANMEWSLGNRQLAISNIDTALNIAIKNNIEEKIPSVYSIKMLFAEAEGRYKNALQYAKEQFRTERLYSDRSQEFDLENYTLKLEKDQLETEKQNQALAIQVQQFQNRNLWMFLLLATLMLGGLGVGYYNQQKSRKALAQQNITIQNQANILQEQAEKLKVLDETKSRFFANVSHELRTPLSLLLGPIHSLMKKKSLQTDELQLLQLASRSGQNLQQLVTEILDLTKLEMGKMELYLERVSLRRFFAQQLVQFDSLAQLQNIQYDYLIDVEEGYTAELDKSKVRQILNNLLSNAFKFTPTGGRILTTIKYQNSEIWLYVEDTGRGIPEEDIPQLFDRYFQTNKPERNGEGGTGIGLAICKEYAELMGGEIWVESQEEKGSIFKVSLPLEISQIEEGQILEQNMLTDPYTSLLAAVQDHSPTNRRGANINKKTILVVEDNPELQTYINLILSPHYRILKAENGEAALAILAGEEKCDLILSDLMMPIMDGFQLLEQVKAKASTRLLPFIMLTARADIQDKLKALRIGVDDYLLKPFIEDELLARIENLLLNYDSRQEALIENGTKENKQKGFSMEENSWLENFETYVQSKIENSNLAVSTLAHYFNMSESTLLRQLKKLTGLTPGKYIQEVRLNEARRLLELQAYRNIATVAYKVGYTDSKAFSRIFKKRFGKSPSEFAQNG